MTMAAEMEQAKDSHMAYVNEQISSAFSDGQEKADFWFDSSGDDGRAKEVSNFLSDQELGIDYWGRSVLSLAQDQATELGRLVAEWNALWEYDVSGDMRDYNAFHISFHPATGQEHYIENAFKSNGSWQSS